jgi:hypothetical protein
MTSNKEYHNPDSIAENRVDMITMRQQTFMRKIHK